MPVLEHSIACLPACSVGDPSENSTDCRDSFSPPSRHGPFSLLLVGPRWAAEASWRLKRLESAALRVDKAAVAGACAVLVLVVVVIVAGVCAASGPDGERERKRLHVMAAPDLVPAVVSTRTCGGLAWLPANLREPVTEDQDALQVTRWTPCM